MLSRCKYRIYIQYNKYNGYIFGYIFGFSLEVAVSLMIFFVKMGCEYDVFVLYLLYSCGLYGYNSLQKW